MISRRTCGIAEEDVVFPRFLYCVRRCSQSSCERFQTLPGLSSVLPGLFLVLPDTLKACSDALEWSNTPLKLTHLCLHSKSSQKLLQVSSEKNPLSWCNCISELARSWPPVNLQTRWIMALKVSLWVHSIGASKFISEFARSRPPIDTPHSMDRGLPGYLQTRLITASKYIFKLTR